MTRFTIFSDFLSLLGVKHTEQFSNSSFRKMTFKSIFGLSRLLDSYGIPNAAFRIADKNEILEIPTPFIVQRNKRFAIVREIGSDPDRTVSWCLFGQKKTAPAAEFLSACSGIVLQAYPDENSVEPDYRKHHFLELAEKAKRWILILCAAVLFIYGFIAAGLYAHVSTWLLCAVNLAGLAVTWLLVLKSLKVQSAAADKMCGVLQKHGCDHVLEDKASKFFGLFGWSEVGFAYFSVSTLILLIFPNMIHTLALVNGCCLPFTLWSIWYQKFRIKTWCTLCVTTQCLLWCQFFCYLFGGWWKGAFPIDPRILLMGAAYLGVMLAINTVCTFINNRSNS